MPMKCPSCGAKIEPKSYRFSKQLTKSGNSLVITISKEIVESLDLKLGDLLDIQVTKQ